MESVDTIESYHLDIRIYIFCLFYNLFFTKRICYFASTTFDVEHHQRCFSYAVGSNFFFKITHFHHIYSNSIFMFKVFFE